MRRSCITNWSRGRVSSGAILPTQFCGATSAPVETTSQPVPVPEETFIRTGLDARHYLESYGYHAVLIVLIYLLSTSAWFNRPVQLPSPYENTTVEHYALSDYLPPINTGPRGEAKPRKGQPKLAKQEILSVPPNPDNNHQTIVTPPNIKLNRDVALPNIVAWTNIPGQPIAASSRQLSQLKIPQFTPQVVEPTADVSKLNARQKVPPLAQPTVVEPTADVSKVKAKLTMSMLAQPAVVEPPLTPDQLKLKRGEINMAQIDRRWPRPSCRCNRSVRVQWAMRRPRTARQKRSCAAQHSGSAVDERTGTDHRAQSESRRRARADRSAERQPQWRVSCVARRQSRCAWNSECCRQPRRDWRRSRRWQGQWLGQREWRQRATGNQCGFRAAGSSDCRSRGNSGEIAQ